MNISIKKGSVSKNSNDRTVRPVQSVEYLGRDGDVEIFFPYGFHANVPEGAMAILFSMLGQSSNKVAMLSAPEERIQVLTGEVVVFHPITKAKIYFKNDGSIVTNTDGATITIAKGGTVTIDSPSVVMTGNLQVNGNINANGSINAGTTISAGVSVSAPQVSGTTGLSGGGKSMVNHTHNYSWTDGAGSGTTGGNN